MLIIQDIFLIVDLANQRIFANLTDIQGSFIVVQDNFLVILNYQDQSLYQFDLVSASLNQIFSLSPTQNYVEFMCIDSDKRLPAIFDGDLIYLQTLDFQFQPFSISQRILKYQSVKLDDTQYYKKSENVIDSQNMIIIKTQQEDNIYIGQTKYGDSQIHFFQTQNDFYWHKNLFNSPYRILYLKPQIQIFLAKQFDNDQNWIAIYDKSSNQITIYNQTDVFKVISMNFLLQSDIKYASSKILQLHQPAKISSTPQIWQILVKYKQTQVHYNVCLTQI
ncbi:hypothetical protein TTHERM_00903850 (macronuclear) [Tetrahymena thermophila SB210]|uniref:Uncharacterized protein n=1 Tax=Tetrahymena thermophila (strain SB210) TaxID=312017 RepID=Q24GB2_TETTS|nr:hypothetical protein TTHERM_00903850 [Tetrahymena thermophila SB210]EAS06818.3 hypothetical protein TTHERM_00903850 [Tetrahymena thermophila SB210]|eukprot:XP_001027060.3 hypothetical protein TTHERM_00903850 [Tetrahymena thermophila SB210]